MHKNIEKILRVAIIILAVYALFEAGIYLFHIRLEGVKAIWPAEVLAYSQLIEWIVGSLFLLISAISFTVQRNLDKYKGFIKISGAWAIFHGGLLIFLGLSQSYVKIFANSPSLHVWFPFYDQYLVAEGIALISYSGIVYLWIKK